MKILVACERSGRVRDAFIARGHDAWSCDIEPSENGGPHIRDDVLSCLEDSWDLMIAHPPCTHLAVSGARWFESKQVEQRKAIFFFMSLVESKIPQYCLENPIGIMSTLWRKPDQIIQPWQFGHPEAKATCLWLKNLPKLRATNLLLPRNGNWKRGWNNQTPSGQNKLGPSATRAYERAKTYPGIASAMAEQWG